MPDVNQKGYQTIVLGALLHDVGKFYQRLGLDLRLKMNIGHNTPALQRTPNALECILNRICQWEGKRT